MDETFQKIRDKIDNSIVKGEYDDPCKECGNTSSRKQQGLKGWEYRCEKCFAKFTENVAKFVKKHN